MKLLARASLLPLVVMTLAVVAALKVGDVWLGFDGASAQAPAAAEETPAQTPAIKPDEAAAPELQPGEVERRILEQLAARRAGLEAREQDLSAREAVIAAAEKRLGDRITAFRQEREQLLALRAEREAQDEAEIEALVSAYERMKSKDAATIFNALDEDILVSVASGMRTQALAGVLAEMLPENARRLTILLAERERLAAASPPSQ